jgi:hypothetical protein
MVLLLPNVLWHQRLGKYARSYKQERYYNAELLCEEVDVMFTVGGKKNGNKLKIEYEIFV